MSLLVNSKDDCIDQQIAVASPSEHATIRDGDRIVVVADANTVEQGSHKDLLRAGGVYRRLHDAQHLVQAQ